MSPEQARGDAVDARSDLFSLGSVMYTMCAGRPPFRAENSYGILRKITDGDPRPLREVNPAIPEWLEWLIAQLLNKSADERFQSADHVAGLLRKCLAHVQQPTVVDLPAECQSLSGQRRLDRASRRTLVVLSLAIVCVASLLFVASVAFREGTTNPKAASPLAPSGAAQNDTSHFGWDESGRAFQTFDQDLKPFEFHVEQLWDVPSLHK